MSTSGANLEKYLIPLDEINRATDSFSRERYIGSGGFGAVYRGQLSEQWQSRTAAVKRRDLDSRQGWREFHNEIELISKFHHENILAFIGYCDEEGEMIIVYEYASNGSLEDHLRDPNKMSCITWADRLEICIGAARGLHYLHSGLGERDKVIHRDVKSANILLDGNMVAKVCDFGLSKLGTTTQSDTQLYTMVAGTQFYMDPMYHESGILRKESDLYSFGVVLFEILSGMLVYSGKRIGDERQSMMNAVRRYHENKPNKVVDPCIRDQINDRSFETFKEIAYRCISMTLTQRPAIHTVIKELEKALRIQLSSPAHVSVIKSIIGKLLSVSRDDRRIAVGEITFLTKHCDQNYAAFVKAGVIPRLAYLITTPDSHTQEHALTILLNLSRTEDRDTILSSVAFPIIIQVLEKGNNEAQEQALAVLLNLNLSLHKDYRAMIISSGASILRIANILEKGSNEARENAAALISHLFDRDGFHKAKQTFGSAGAIAHLVLLLSEGTTKGKVYAIYALDNLCDNYDDNCERAVRARLVPILIELLKEPQGNLKQFSMRLLERLSCHPEGNLAIIEAEAVPNLVELLGSGSPGSQQQAFIVLLKLFSMDEKYMVEAQEHGILEKIKGVRYHGNDWIRQKAMEVRRMIKDHHHLDYGSDSEYLVKFERDGRDSWLVSIAKGGALQISMIFYFISKCLR